LGAGLGVDDVDGAVGCGHDREVVAGCIDDGDIEGDELVAWLICGQRSTDPLVVVKVSLTS
jgi:hypothetical protein